MKDKQKHYDLTVLIEKDEDGFYIGTVPALKSCYTQAKTLEELYPRIKEVISLCLEKQQPELLKFVGVQQIQVAA
ncbi:type II toxin-antitoxin system HicB family antitoxin [candidate division KSB1 bacterium]|nr:type II toxin-antitoxin system HicB family antitoxin [candidate division KSB1 bacterium]MBL7093862.1 type II toxin-antitoxin system HicB family antitoxin [candidate division KSB1 bacterium]